jgi:PAS domain S-box-containing protein
MYKEHLEFLVKNRTLELEKEKSFSESVIENIPNMIFVKDAKELKFELFNRAGEKLLGQKRENLIGKSDYNFFPKKQADFFTNKDRHVLKSKKLLDIPEEPIKTPRGERLLHTKKIPILNKQGKPLSLLGISEDITERKEAEEKYKSLYESSADAIMTLEPPSWKFTSGNPATIKMFKIKNEKEFISKAPWEYSPKYQPDKQLSSEKAKKMIMRAMEEGSNLFEWTHKRFNGENFPATVLLSRIKRDGKTYLQATVRDITEQKKMEEKAKESDIMKTEFLSAISHELRTPITPIKSQIQRLLSTELDKKEQIDSLEIALRNTIRMDRLIQDLLEISRIKAGKFNIFKKKADLNKTINEAIIDLSGFIKEKNTSITFEAGKIPEINMDRDRILEVIINILDNSIKFGKGKISISTKKEGNSILIKIKDNGIGIIQNEKIFSPFYRGEKIDSQKYEGTGLGLSICRGIIETHNGKIWFDSKRGEGTTFFVKIPIK